MTVENEQTDAAPSTPESRGDFVTEPKAPEAAAPAVEEAAPPAEEAATKPAEGEDPGNPTKAAEGEQPRDPDTGKWIPKARFDKAGERAKIREASLQERIASLTKELLASQFGDAEELEAQLADKSAKYTKMLADGELEQANAMLMDINRLNRKLAGLEAAPVATAQATAATEETTFAELLDIYQEEFPSLAKGSKTYDEEQVKWTNAKLVLFLGAGMSRTEALREAVELAVAKFGLQPVSTAAPAEKPSPDAERKAKTVEKVVAAAKGQSPKTDGVGLDSDKAGAAKIKVSELSQDEFAKLPEAVIRRQRGDFL